jgi:ribosome-associated protein
VAAIAPPARRLFRMAEDLVTPGGIVIPVDAMTWRFSRGTGPGGQGVNTADSRVELVADLRAIRAPRAVRDRVRAALGDSVRIVARAERSQLRNRQAALARMAERVDRAARPVRPRRPTRPTRGSVRKRLEDKRQRSQTKTRRKPPTEDL